MNRGVKRTKPGGKAGRRLAAGVKRAKARPKAKTPRAGRSPKPKPKATRARKSPQREGADARSLRKRLTEALEQQAATSEILRVISRSPTDVQPVFDTIASAALKLCNASVALVARCDGGLISVGGLANLTPEGAESVRQTLPRPPGRESATGRAIETRSVIAIPDVSEDRTYAVTASAMLAGFRSVLSVPLLRDGSAIGALTVGRPVPGTFSDQQVGLLKTFADQAVIAIENVRLFGEVESRNHDLTEALEQQTATSEILRVISQSQTDVQPVFDTIAAAALKLCGASSANVFTFDGELIHLVPLANLNPGYTEALRQVFPRAPGRDTAVGRAILTRSVATIPDVLDDPEYAIKGAAVAGGFRSSLGVPLIREGIPIGAIAVGRPEPGPIPDKQIALLQTFADQAVIAIENVRLFTELEARNNELHIALEHQTATSELLRVIGRSAFDLQPVFETLAENAARLCSAQRALIFRFDGQLMRFAVGHNVSPELREFFDLHPIVPGRGSNAGRAALERRTIHNHDVLTDPEYSYGGYKVDPYRTVLAVPMLKADELLGVVIIYRHEVRPFSDDQVALMETFADQAVIAIENVRLFNETREALERQTATAEILKVISSSPTDVQPVFGAIAERAAALCEAEFGFVATYDGDVIHHRASVGPSSEALELHRAGYPMKPGTGSVTARVVLQGVPVQIEDMFADPTYAQKIAAEKGGFRSGMGVPMVRDGKVIGAIVVVRTVPGKFSERQVGLLQTFADQAVIAIENVRLFTELQARNRDLTIALDQQTATSEILRVISSSQTDVQPVFDAIVRSVVRLCGADHSIAAGFDGELLHPLAHHGFSPEALKIVELMFPMRPGPENMLGRAALSKAVVNLPDMLADPTYSRDYAMAGGWRSGLGVPMLRDGELIGAIAVSRREAGAFPDHLVALLTTFADQAVIAIENVRLFTELEARNRELTEALEQQTATSDILRVISQSPRDVQPVFDTIAAAALKLCSATSAVVTTFDGELIRVGGLANVSPEGADAVRARYPRPPGRYNAASRAVLTRSLVVIPDVLEDSEYEIRAPLITAGFRSVAAVPLLRDGHPLGAITVVRPEPGTFPDKQIALLSTFADQAVIAIENVRLFRELENRNRDLTEALEHQTATSEILRVISSSPTDVQPVFDIIAERAARLCDAQVSLVSRLEGELIQLVALHGMSEEAKEISRRYFPMQLSVESATSRAIRDCALVHFTDVMADPQYGPKDAAKSGGWRSCLAVPMVREGRVTGAIFVGRANPGRFADSKIELLKTFADQAVIAIENVRLFTELGVRNRDLSEALEQQTATAEILRAISRSQTDVQAVFDTIVRNAVRLCAAKFCAVFRFDGEEVHFVTHNNLPPAGVREMASMFPMRPIPESPAGRAILTKAVVHLRDALLDSGYARRFAEIIGWREVLAVPMLREGFPVGAIVVAWAECGSMQQRHEELLRTFADQAVIAIENVRLFTELQARTAQLTRSVGELKALGDVGQAVSSTLDLSTVLNTIVSRATKLAGMDGGSIWEYDETREEFYLHATDKLPDELIEALRATPIKKGEGALGRLAVTGEPVQVRDIVDEGVYQSRVREILIRLGYRSLLAVPLLREDRLLGGLSVNRKSTGEFAPEVIDLMKTFATQSALAIQNARLFREIELKSRQLEIASQHKSEFLANMSHELRTPLNAIIGFSEVLYERMFGEINDKQAEYLTDILESGRHLLSLINDILDLSKIEAGRMELEPSEFDLPGAIENTLILVRERAQRREITLRRTLDARVGTIRADERKVKQVLLNLLSNALKFTPEGGRIDVVAGVHDGVTEISVTDTGVGIAPEDQATVFEEFRQVGAASRKVEGTGLGLAISRKFIELHGGKIWVKSQPGVGSTFTFTLPLTIDRQIETPREA